MHANTRKAPASLIENGQYSDERFIDMMAAHHAVAIEMAKVAKEKGEHPEITNLAQKIVETQSEEIQKLASIKGEHFGSDVVATEPDDDERSMHGMATNAELKKANPFDGAFIRNQIPHHAAAIEMAAVAERESKIQQIREMSVQIIQSQAEEIGNMINWQKMWYGSL